MSDNYLEINKNSWNNRVDAHLHSAFYDVQGFINGKSSLNAIELELLGDVRGLEILHLQCHFGQDSISLARMGAKVTGVDLSDKAIDAAIELNAKTQNDAEFICCDIYSLPDHLNKKFDVVYTSYGTIGWLPDLYKWAAVINCYLKPGGRFIMAEFHPVVWMFDEQFSAIKYSYFNTGVIIENENGTYADRDANIQQDYVMWNHGLSEVLGSLLEVGLVLKSFREFDYSPYNCFLETKEYEQGKFRIKHLENRIPMVYSLLVMK